MKTKLVSCLFLFAAAMAAAAPFPRVVTIPPITTPPAPRVTVSADTQRILDYLYAARLNDKVDQQRNEIQDALAPGLGYRELALEAKGRAQRCTFAIEAVLILNGVRPLPPLLALPAPVPTSGNEASAY